MFVLPLSQFPPSSLSLTLLFSHPESENNILLLCYLSMALALECAPAQSDIYLLSGSVKTFITV